MTTESVSQCNTAAHCFKSHLQLEKHVDSVWVTFLNKISQSYSDFTFAPDTWEYIQMFSFGLDTQNVELHPHPHPFFSINFVMCIDSLQTEHG